MTTAGTEYGGPRRRVVTGRRIAGLAATLLIPASAFAAAPPPIIESRPMDLQGSATAASGGVAAGSLEDRVTRLERQADNPVLLEMLARLEALQREVQELRGMVEVQDHGMSGIEQRQRDLYLDIDRRIRRLEEASAARQQNAAAPTVPAPVVAAPGLASATGAGAGSVTGPGAGSAQESDPDAERLAYQRAFDSLQAGRYEESIASFRNFLSRYPDGQYSANAQYWLGEAKYVTRQFSDAIVEFGKVLQHYPDSGKAADAMLKLGFSQYELQDWDKAGETLNRLVERYPASTARQLAENRLRTMRVEGR